MTLGVVNEARRLTSSRLRVLACGLLGAGLALGCATMGLRSAVPMKVERPEGTPKDALVYVDEQYVGTLELVAKNGMRIPEGEHRLSVEKNGYYPFDTIIVSDRDPIVVRVELLKLPD